MQRKLKEGQLILNEPQPNLPTDTEAEGITIVKRKTTPNHFEAARKEMQAVFCEAGIETREQILDLIQDVKKELFEERYPSMKIFLDMNFSLQDFRQSSPNR